MIRHGTAPFLECSSKGDKRFSAYYARIRGRRGKSIETIYQAAKEFHCNETGKIITGLPIDEARGFRPINGVVVRELYSRLWDEYMMENPDLLPVICAASGLSDRFGKPGHCCQATELWRIRNSWMVDFTVDE